MLRWIVILFLLSMAFLIAFVGYFFVLHHQPLVLPAPTGSQNVGRAEFDWIDRDRMDPLSDQANGKRELLIWAWYPVSGSVQGPAASYLPSAWVKAHNKDQGLGRFLESDFSSIQIHARENVTMETSQTPYPVIVMQPGMGPVPTDYTVFAEDLASHGYVVFGINETDTSNLIVFPDGRVVPRSEKGVIPDNADVTAVDADANRIGAVWADDAIFVANMIQDMNEDPSSFFYDRLDLAHIGFFGHSFGGATAARVCKVDPRCKAGADLDGTLFSDQAKGNLQSPFLFMAEDDCGKDCDTMIQAYATSNGPAYYLSIKNTKHFNFSDLPLRWLPPVRILFKGAGYIGSISPERGLEISSAYLVAFFDRYLKNRESDLLQGLSPAYPEVQFEKNNPAK